MIGMFLYCTGSTNVNGRMNPWEGCGRKVLWPIFKTLTQHLYEGTKRNQDKPQSDLGMKYIPVTSQIWRSANYATATFSTIDIKYTLLKTTNYTKLQIVFKSNMSGLLIACKYWPQTNTKKAN